MKWISHPGHTELTCQRVIEVSVRLSLGVALFRYHWSLPISGCPAHLACWIGGGERCFLIGSSVLWVTNTVEFLLIFHLPTWKWECVARNKASRISRYHSTPPTFTALAVLSFKQTRSGIDTGNVTSFPFWLWLAFTQVYNRKLCMNKALQRWRAESTTALYFTKNC